MRRAGGHCFLSCLAGASSLHRLALLDARHRPVAARAATGSARDGSPGVKTREARGRQARNSLSPRGCLLERDLGRVLSVDGVDDLCQCDIFPHPLATAHWLSKQYTSASMQSLCSPLSPSRASHRPPPQPFLSTPKRIGPPPACLSSPYSSLQTLESTPATRDLLPLHASHARRPMTGRRNPLV